MLLDPLPPRACRSNPKYTFSDVETDNEGEPLFDSPEADIELSPSTFASSPVSPLSRSSHTRKRSPSHIRRPRNAFIIFRSEFCDQQKMSERGIETDHRHISRIAAHIWNELPEGKKVVYKRRAEDEKAAHKAAYPNYRYAPIGRPRSVVKQRLNRGSNNETLRCRKVAELYMAGLKGEELGSAIKALDETITPEPSLSHYASPPKQKRTRPRPRSLKKRQKQINFSPSPSPSPFSSPSPPQQPSSLSKAKVCVGSLEVCASSQDDIEVPAKSRDTSPEHASTFEIGEFNHLHDCSSPPTMPKEKQSIVSKLLQESTSTFLTDPTNLESMDESSDVFSNLTLGQLFRATPEFPDSPDSGLTYFTALSGSVNDFDESGEAHHPSPETPLPTSNETLFSDTRPRETAPFKLEGKEMFDTHFGDGMFMYTDSKDMTEIDLYLDL